MRFTTKCVRFLELCTTIVFLVLALAWQYPTCSFPRQIVLDALIQNGQMKLHQLIFGDGPHCHLMELLWKVETLLMESLVEHPCTRFVWRWCECILIIYTGREYRCLNYCIVKSGTNCTHLETKTPATTKHRSATPQARVAGQRRKYQQKTGPGPPKLVPQASLTG